MKTLAHYTLNTDHIVHSPRDQVSENALEFCWDIIKKSITEKNEIFLTDADLPMHSILCKEQEGKLFCDMFISQDDKKQPLVRFTVTKMPEPRCDVTTLEMDIESAVWLADFERCIAWAWIEKGGL